MFEVRKTFTIAGAHFLPEHPGKCREVHGHNWKVTVVCRQKELTPEGMVMDFGDIKRHVMDKLDHKTFNDIIENPTAERIAAWIQGYIGLPCTEVIVEESEGSIARYVISDK
jgi:6-pyruvoyltetrahydropterin/6-carboxytetrahydropterin synthase